MSDGISGSFKGGLTIHIFLETDRQWLEMVLVNFLESSCPNLCVIGPDFIQHCEEWIICTAIIITIPYKARRWGGILEAITIWAAFDFLVLATQILSSFKFSLFSGLDRHTPFSCNKPWLNVCGFDLNCSLSFHFFLLFLSMICQGASVTTGRKGIGSLIDHFKAGWVSGGI